jgi:hypothetical protein
MSSTAKQAKTTALESIRAIPFRVHGRPTCRNYETFKEEASALASKVEDITYAWSENATDNYRLLTHILGADKYDELTGIDSYAFPCKPASYDPTITNATLTHERKWKEVEWDLILTAWFICKGFLQGVVNNQHNALDKQYYSQLKHRLTAYRNITPHQILEHPRTNGAPLTFKQRRC